MSVSLTRYRNSAGLMLKCKEICSQKTKVQGKKAKKEKSLVADLKKTWSKLFPSEYHTFYSIKKNLRILNVSCKSEPPDNEQKIEELGTASDLSSDDANSGNEAQAFPQDNYVRD